MSEWRPVLGFEGLYSVSDTGEVRRESGLTSNGRLWKGGLLSPSLNRHGYVKYTLHKDGIAHYKVAHRLVCEAFFGQHPKDKPLALHRDDNPQNNSVQNLYWGSLSDNQLDVLSNENNFGRNKTECVNGHEYTEVNTYWNPRKGTRSCKTCRYEHTRNSQRRKREKRNGSNSED